MTITRLTWASIKAELTALLIVFALFQAAISTSTQAKPFRISLHISPHPIDKAAVCRIPYVLSDAPGHTHSVLLSLYRGRSGSLWTVSPDLFVVRKHFDRIFRLMERDGIRPTDLAN
jgi:hypothetical protein